MRHLGSLIIACTVLAAACGTSGPDAPPVVGAELVCASNFCVEYPDSWELAEDAADFVSLRHPLAPELIVATVGQVNMEGVVNADGKQWPQTPDSVVRSFWALIDGGGADLATLSPQADGSIESLGTFADGRLWYKLTPLEGRRAIGVEVRGPNSTWDSHAETIMDSLLILEP